MFKEVGFQLKIKTNLKKVEFLDVTFNLITGLYTPYKKPNDNLLYINTSSDHTSQIIKQLIPSTRDYAKIRQMKKFLTLQNQNMKMLYTGAGTKAEYSKETYQHNSKKRTRNITHHFLKPLKLTLQNHSSDYWINIFQSLTHYTRSLTETPSKLFIVV